MSFLAWLRCFLTSPDAEEHLTAKLHLRSKLWLIKLKARNLLRRRRCCPECGGRPIIWGGRTGYICFCGCGHCRLLCQGRVMKEAIRDWNARRNMYKDGEPLSNR